MTERLGQITERIDAIHQLGSVVKAMRGIASARAARAREDLDAVDAHAGLIVGAIRAVLPLAPLPEPAPAARHALVAFGAEQGFVGGFAQRLLSALGGEAEADIFLIGTRAATLAPEHGVEPVWQAEMALDPSGIPQLADRIAEALFARVAQGRIGSLEAVWSAEDNAKAESTGIVRRRLFPLEREAFADRGATTPPLMTMAPGDLLEALTEDYVHAQLCMAALHAFAAENSARMEAMAAAGRQIDRMLGRLEERRRQVRQQEITAEILELAAGERVARDAAPGRA